MSITVKMSRTITRLTFWATQLHRYSRATPKSCYLKHCISMVGLTLLVPGAKCDRTHYSATESSSRAKFEAA